MGKIFANNNEVKVHAEFNMHYYFHICFIISLYLTN